MSSKRPSKLERELAKRAEERPRDGGGKGLHAFLIGGKAKTAPPVESTGGVELTPPVETKPPVDLAPPIESTPAVVLQPPAKPTPAARTTPGSKQAPMPLSMTGGVNLTGGVRLTGEQEAVRVKIRSHYARVLNAVLDDLLRTLPPAAGYVYLQCYRLSYGFGKTHCWTSVPNLEERTGLGESTARRGLQQLEQRGLVIRRGEDHKAKNPQDRGIYLEVCLPPGVPDDAVAPVDSTGGVDMTGGVSSTPNKEIHEKNHVKAPDAAAPALDVFGIRTIAARLFEAHRGELGFDRERLRRLVVDALIGQGRAVDEATIDEAIGSMVV